MKILAHRGLWTRPEEKNTLSSLTKALEKGFGIETDFRDYKERLVISHNVASPFSPSAEDFFRWYSETKRTEFLALNVKADGIQFLMKPLLLKYGITNYALFDSSVPEMVVNRAESLAFLSRRSDIEPEPVLYSSAIGVWMDSFFDESWLTLDKIRYFLKDGKKVVLVSSDLHGKPYESLWGKINQRDLINISDFMLCTDHPLEAKEYFYGKN